MNTEQLKPVQVMMTGDVARSLVAANARNLSRSAWIRALIESALRDEAMT